MKKTDPNSVAKRIREIAAEISSITEFAEGSIASSRKQYALKDGTVRRASPQFRFQTKGGRGKQVCKYVPPCAVARVKELIENGRRYRRLDEVMSSVAFRGGLRGRQNQAALSEGARGVEGGESPARLPRQAQGEYALWMAAQERILHLLFARRGGRKDPRRTPVQAGGNALAPPQRRMRLRHHRQTALRSMRTTAMDDYFFNKIKSHPES